MRRWPLSTLSLALLLAAVQADSSLKTVRGVGYRIDLVPADAAT